MMQRLPLFLRLVAVVLVASGALACQTMRDPLDSRGDFEEMQRKFTQHIRWGHIEEAAAFVVEDQRSEFLDLAPDLSDVRFTSYEIIDVVHGKGLDTATVEVKYTGYRLSWPIEKTVKVTQEWSREDGPWQVRLELTKIRKALALATS
jgi:hypothetical protein